MCPLKQCCGDCHPNIYGGRKNWLFSDTAKGVFVSASVYSIMETARANDLNVDTYLEYLLLYLPDTDWQNHPEDLDDLMPWSKTVQKNVKHKYP